MSYIKELQRRTEQKQKEIKAEKEENNLREVYFRIEQGVCLGQYKTLEMHITLLTPNVFEFIHTSSLKLIQNPLNPNDFQISWERD